MSGSAPAGPGRRARLAAWLEARLQFGWVRALAREKQVPVHRHTIWYYFGGMTLFLFTVQVGTGILLLFYYRPSADEAFESVQFLMAEVQFGWLVRSIHAWAANLMILTLFVHFFSALLLRAYRAPRELTWFSGLGLLGLALGFGFTGYLLPWNELAYFATRVGTQMVAVVPAVGSFLLQVLRGGDEVSGATLTRFYAIHVAVLPAAVLVFLALHLYLVQLHGMSSPPGETPGRAMPFVPNFLLRDAVGWLAALAMLATLAAFFPTELGSKADPFVPAPAGIRPEWYFMFMFQTLKLLPAHILGIEGETVGILAFGVVGLLLVLLPLLDRPAAPRRAVTWLGVGLLAYAIVLTAVGYAANPTQ